ncbi:hypothetical protein Taro_043392 [Colocasia esculenta]|uniref:Probable magnesium transporter n=1 Tax=Colocasia esculenta TaxID=4460 RepID=A0A843WVM3_COLES|nr:hypothetical protein [Colocasia esculenta]
MVEMFGMQGLKAVALAPTTAAFGHSSEKPYGQMGSRWGLVGLKQPRRAKAPKCAALHALVPAWAASLPHEKDELALDTFNTAIVSPIYYVMFTTLTIVASVIMFKDWDGQSGGSIISEICGFIVVLSGTILLHVTKDLDRSPSRRSIYAQLSPSLSARLCDENGELLKHVTEAVSSTDNVSFRRQDLF